MNKESISTKVAVMGVEMKAMTKKLDDHILDQKKKWENLYIKLDGLGTKLDKKYAGKWVETVSIAVLAAVVSGLIIYFATRGN